MNPPRYHLLFALVCILLLCSSVQGVDLLISVRDNIDNTSVPQATVFVNGANYARTNNNGQAFLTHNGQNEQTIRVVMSGYEDWEKTVGKNVTTLYANLSRKTITLKVFLYDSDTLAPIPGAKVNITVANSTLGKVTDATGAATFAAKANYLYSVDVDAANYQPRSATIDMGTEDKEVQYWLLSGNRFSVKVRDKDTKLPVSGAEVRIDSTLVGKTDDRGILNTPVTRNKNHLFEIRTPGYQTVTESRTITESDAIYTVDVSKAAIGAFVYVFDENKNPLTDANVYFNGTLSGTTNEYGRSNLPSLVSGTYRVEVKKDGYVTETRTVVITDTAEDYTFNLAYESAALSVFVQDKDQKIVSNATVSVGGNNAGVTNERGELVTKIKINTPVNITVSKDGYSPVSVEEEIIQGNATGSVNIVLEKNMDLGLVTMIGFGILIILVLFVAIRSIGGRKHRHILRKDEI